MVERMPGRVTCHLLELVGAVDLGGLEELHVDAGNGGEVEDGAPAHVLPHADQGVGQLPGRAIGQEGNILVNQAVLQQGLVDDAGGGGEDLQHHTADDDPAQEVGQVQQRLGDALDALVLNLVQHDGQDDRNREAHDEAHQVQ